RSARISPCRHFTGSPRVPLGARSATVRNRCEVKSLGFILSAVRDSLQSRMNRSHDLWHQGTRPLHEALGATLITANNNESPALAPIDIELFAGAGGMTLG